MFVKLFNKILDSSIWEESAATRVVWVTLLASMDSDGFCQFATVETLARRARIKPCLVKDAVAILEAPDGHSSTPTDDGRRIERVAGGWIVLNAKKYRDISRSGELRKSHPKPSQLVSTGLNSSEPVSSIEVNASGINKSLPEVEVEVDIKTTAKSGNGISTPPKPKTPKKKNKRAFDFSGYKVDVSEVVNHLEPKWPRYRAGDPKKGKVDVSQAKLADRIEALLDEGWTPQTLTAVGDMYLDENPDWPNCPHFFFGKTDDAPYKAYAKMLIHRQKKQAATQ